MSAIIKEKLGNLVMLFVLLGMIVFFSFAAPHFLEMNNFFNVARQIATLGIAAVGMTIVLVTGGIDLSMGYQMSVINVVCAILMVRHGIDMVPAILCGLLIGTALGFINGVIIVKSGVAPLIVTLAIMNILYGTSYILSGGIPIFGFPEGFSFLGQGSIGVIPVSLIVMIGTIALGWILLSKSFIGRYFYAIGSNEEATKLSGVNTGKYKVLAYTICGFLGGVGAIIMLSRTNSGLSSNGAGFEFNVITACVLGGVSANGGKGTVLGATIGVLIVGVIDNALLLMNINQFSQLVMRGLLMLVAVIYDTHVRKRGEYVKKIKSINAENAVN